MTLFTWGYFGWGNATEYLVQNVDTVERKRGFAPPLFVDTRIRRSVRAHGFQGAAFGNLLGPARYRWMQGLGNEAIRTREGGIRISDPGQADDLLDLALEDSSRRILFFCSCRWPRLDGQVHCHRCAVADLVVKSARKRSEAIDIIEWPGGEPGEVVLSVPLNVFASLRRGRASVPLGTTLPAASLGGLAWGSIVQVECAGKVAWLISGPARYRSGEWELPVLELLRDGAGLAKGMALRRSFGLEGRRQ